MPSWDFSTNPFTVYAITPSGATVTPSTSGTHQLNFDAGVGYDAGVGFFGELHLPLSNADVGVGPRQRLDNWYGSLEVLNRTGVGFFLLDDSTTNSYGDNSRPATGTPGTWDTVPFGTASGGFASGALPSACPLATNLYLKVTFAADGPTFALRSLSVTLVGGINVDCGPTYPYGEDGDPHLILSETLTLSDNLSLLLRDTGSPPPSGGTGYPPRYSDGDFLDSCDPTSTAPTVCTRTSRSIPSALAAHLSGEALTLAYCLRLARRDGEVFGFTTHDEDLAFDPGDGDVTFEALNSLSVTALRQELGATVGSMDLAGLISSEKVTAADLLAGRYDGAELTLFLVNWDSLSDGFVTLARGWWGAVTVVDGQWKAEYRSVAQRLQQQIVELTSSTCRVAQLGDERCKVNLTPFQFSRTVTAVTDNRNFTFGGDSHASGYFAAGRVIWTAGDNTGLEQEVKRNTPTGGAQVIELQLGAPFAVTVGDVATLEAGCDRRLGTCRDRFHNTVNFRGEPHVPGSEVLRRVKSLQVVG